ncbi:hypothetical protein FOL47_005756 [Perkinsus chesapeaki]|uniref:Immunoglobulin super DCC subclass member n=1 Tax=Perkinsus chesapeaki TaxID=330153 RepID=A0A7J6LVS6_PERCH|nr:hypothetical protein FOL47_005756 [Perkinsus chesapeaki]
MSASLKTVFVGAAMFTAINGQTTISPATSTTATTTISDDVVRHTCDLYCQSLNGAESFCKSWQDNAVCQGGNQACGNLDICGPAVTTGSSVSTGTSVFDPECDKMCQSLNDASSYCKWWKDVPVCSGGDQPCGDTSVCNSQTWPTARTPSAVNGPHLYHSPTCDVHCQNLNDVGSYCKWWMAQPVCQGGNQVCTPTVCGAGEPTVAPTTDIFHMGQSSNCDAYCEDLNPGLLGGERSHCKWYLHIAVCHQGDQVCTPSVCENYTRAP